MKKKVKATTDAHRSAVMRAVKSVNTGPEVALRRLLHAEGYRFRLHAKYLPGRPDLVLPGRRAVILVHGCFWHGHDCKRGNRHPKQNANYWRVKIERNKMRDRQNELLLRKMGWRVSVVWECSLKEPSTLMLRLRKFLKTALATSQ